MKHKELHDFDRISKKSIKLLYDFVKHKGFVRPGEMLLDSSNQVKYEYMAIFASSFARWRGISFRNFKISGDYASWLAYSDLPTGVACLGKLDPG